MRRSSNRWLHAAGRHMVLVAAGLVSTVLATAVAQTPPPMPSGVPAARAVPASPGTASVPATPASAADPAAPPSVLRTRPDPARRLSPAEVSAAARAPDGQTPARAVVPQILIPIGRQAPTADAPPPGRPAARGVSPPASGRIDDAAARCESREDDMGRANCRREAERTRTRP